MEFSPGVMIVNLSRHQKSVVSTTQHMPCAGGGERVLLASHNPSGWLVYLTFLTWALLSPSRSHCLMLGSCSPICYLCMKCPAKLTGASLLQPARWPGTCCSWFEREQAVSWVHSGFIPNFPTDQMRASILVLLFLEVPSPWLSSPSANTVLSFTVPSAVFLSVCKIKQQMPYWMWILSCAISKLWIAWLECMFL